MHDVCITVVNYKMKEHIERCFVSLFEDLQGENLNIKVIVVDNGSSDGIKNFLAEKYPSVECIELPENVGFGKAQNVGLKSAEAKYYFVLNPDTYFKPGGKIIRQLHDWLEAHPKVGMVGPKIVYPDGSLQYSCYRFPGLLHPLVSRGNFETGWGKKLHDTALMRDFDHNETRPVDWVMGSAMFVRGSAMQEVGMFDDRFWMYYEDSDWCRRMWEKGWPVYYAHHIVLEHLHGRGSAKVPGTFTALFKNKLARVHLLSWLKYAWKWRGNTKFYSHAP
jgi:GT2 family glycosyltransferase